MFIKDLERNRAGLVSDRNTAPYASLSIGLSICMHGPLGIKGNPNQRPEVAFVPRRQGSSLAKAVLGVSQLPPGHLLGTCFENSEVKHKLIIAYIISGSLFEVKMSGSLSDLICILLDIHHSVLLLKV